MKHPESPLRRHVLAALGDGALDLAGLARALGVKRSDRRRLRATVKTLCVEGKLTVLKGGRYRLAPASTEELQGTLRVRRGGGAFVQLEDGRSVAIPASHVGTALDGDKVGVSVHTPPGAVPRKGRRDATPPPRGRSDLGGAVTGVLERHRTTVVGFLADTSEGPVVLPSDPKIPRPVPVLRDETGARPGDAVVGQLAPSSRPDAPPLLILKRRLGGPRDAGILAAMVLAEQGIEADFPPDLLAIDPGEPGPDSLAGRKDHRDLTTVTIDGADARDFDDALSLVREGEKFRLFVHIADVGAYVTPGSRLDAEARRRGTTVYFAGGCVPMLPPRLSGELCSLLPERDRLALTCEILLDGTGAIVRSTVYRSLIRSDARLTYDEVDVILDRNAGASPEIVELLVGLSALTDLRKARRKSRGGLDLFLPEAQPIMDEAGRLVTIRRQAQLLSYRLVEECMLAANECVARHADRRKLPILYRRHDAPGADALTELRRVLDLYGVESSDLELTTPPAWRCLLDRLTLIPEAAVLLPDLIRSQMRAAYAAEPSGHFGLALSRYCHFTSPIRRYPDLWTHQVLTGARGAGGGGGETARVALAEACSTTEQVADVVDREVLRRMSVEMMSEMTGCRFAATVSGIHPFGCFVEIDDPFVEGMVPVGALEDDYYLFVETKQMLTGRSTGRVFRRGTRLDVVLTRADRRTWRLDFAPRPAGSS